MRRSEETRGAPGSRGTTASGDRFIFRMIATPSVTFAERASRRISPKRCSKRFESDGSAGRSTLAVTSLHHDATVTLGAPARGWPGWAVWGWACLKPEVSNRQPGQPQPGCPEGTDRVGIRYVTAKRLSPVPSRLVKRSSHTVRGNPRDARSGNNAGVAIILEERDRSPGRVSCPESRAAPRVVLRCAECHRPTGSVRSTIERQRRARLVSQDGNAAIAGAA